MNFVADIGNSAIKAAIYEKGRKIGFNRFSFDEEKEFREFVRQASFNKAIISSVKEIPGYIEESIREKAEHIQILSSNSRLPFIVDYQTPETLGSDRIAAVAGAFRAFAGENCLIIDAGSAITFDFLLNGHFKGGNISPGIEMRFMALHSFTDRLPLVDRRDSFSFPGVDTIDAITAGVISGIIFEINEYIRTFKQKYQGSIIITGGDGEFLSEKVLGKPYYMPDLVIDGLNFILEYNA